MMYTTVVAILDIVYISKHFWTLPYRMA